MSVAVELLHILLRQWLRKFINLRVDITAVQKGIFRLLDSCLLLAHHQVVIIIELLNLG